MGLVASFLALNSVFGHFFSVSAAEAADPETARSSIEKFSHQFIFNVQVHNVYAELGAVFAGTCAAYPGLCAGILAR